MTTSTVEADYPYPIPRKNKNQKKSNPLCCYHWKALLCQTRKQKLVVDCYLWCKGSNCRGRFQGLSDPWPDWTPSRCPGRAWVLDRLCWYFGKNSFLSLGLIPLSLSYSGSLCSLPPAFKISEVAGSQLHLSKLDWVLVALPMEPVNTLTVVIVPVSAHQVDTMTVLIPESSFVGQSTVGDGWVCVLVIGREGSAIVIVHGVTCCSTVSFYLQLVATLGVSHTESVIHCKGWLPMVL